MWHFHSILQKMGRYFFIIDQTFSVRYCKKRRKNIQANVNQSVFWNYYFYYYYYVVDRSYRVEHFNQVQNQLGRLSMNTITSKSAPAIILKYTNIDNVYRLAWSCVWLGAIASIGGLLCKFNLARIISRLFFFFGKYF